MIVPVGSPNVLPYLAYLVSRRPILCASVWPMSSPLDPAPHSRTSFKWQRSAKLVLAARCPSPRHAGVRGGTYGSVALRDPFAAAPQPAWRALPFQHAARKAREAARQVVPTPLAPTPTAALHPLTPPCTVRSHFSSIALATSQTPPSTRMQCCRCSRAYSAPRPSHPSLSCRLPPVEAGSHKERESVAHLATTHLSGGRVSTRGSVTAAGGAQSSTHAHRLLHTAFRLPRTCQSGGSSRERSGSQVQVVLSGLEPPSAPPEPKPALPQLSMRNSSSGEFVPSPEPSEVTELPTPTETSVESSWPSAAAEPNPHAEASAAAEPSPPHPASIPPDNTHQSSAEAQADLPDEAPVGEASDRILNNAVAEASGSRESRSSSTDLRT